MEPPVLLDRSDTADLTDQTDRPPDAAAEVEEILATRVYRGTARRLARLCDAATARDIIVEYDHAVARGHLNGPGAIAARLETGQWPQDRVRTAAEIRASAEAAERHRATERAAQATRAAESEQAQAAAADLEARFGPVLDGMSPEELDGLAREVLGSFYRTWKAGRCVALFREQLLVALSSSRLG